MVVRMLPDRDDGGQIQATSARVRTRGAKQRDRLLREGRMNEMESQLTDSETGRCPNCGKLFPTKEDLSKHLEDEHPDDTLGNMLT
jgi:hypothetical protein